MERLKTILIVILAVISSAIGIAGSNSVQRVYAAETLQTIYERQNVLDDLKGSTINQTKFDILDYPYNANGEPQLISFIEFCYSSIIEKQTDYALYIYVYNPAKKEFNFKSEKNCIQLRTGGKTNESFSNDYKLKFINKSSDSLFIKFKIDLTTVQKQSILNRVKGIERVYEVSGFELMSDKEITEYSVSRIYKYSGFVKGYANIAAQDGTLNCITDKLEKTLSLDVCSTAYRPKGTNGSAYKQDTLHSVYFSVPNEFIEKSGKMTKVHAKWLNAYTAPMLVTGNKYYYDRFFEQIGKEASGKYAFHTNQEGRYWGGHYFVKYSHGYNYTDNVENVISGLHYVFYAENGNADNYTVSPEMLVGNKKRGEKGWFETYTENYSSTDANLVDERFDDKLFEMVDNDYTEKTISEEDEDFKLTGIEYSSKTLWQKLYGLSADIEFKNEYSISPIQKVTVDDVKILNDKIAFCNEFYIHEIDYDNFIEYVNKANEKNETVYLFRYMQSEYFSAELAEGEYKTGFIKLPNNPIPTWGTYFDESDTNAFVCQTWVQLGFDIIDLTFNLNNVETVIPVIMSPTDIAPPLDHPVITTPDFEFWHYGVGMIAALAAVAIITKIIERRAG